MVEVPFNDTHKVSHYLFMRVISPISHENGRESRTQLTMVQDSLKLGHKILRYPMSSGASEWASEQTNEHSIAREQYGASEGVSGVSERASEWPSNLRVHLIVILPNVQYAHNCDKIISCYCHWHLVRVFGETGLSLKWTRVTSTANISAEIRLT